MVLESILDPVLGWVLAMPLWLGIFLLSLILTLLINIIYKYVTDQEEMKRLKTRLKEFQTDLKKHRDNPKKLQKLQSEMMSVNIEYTKKSLKPMLYTFIPLIIIFGWMNANLAYGIIGPDEPVSLTVFMEGPARLTLETELAIEGEPTRDTIESQTSWTVSGPPGVHALHIITEDGKRASHPVYIGQRPENILMKQESPFKQTQVKYAKATPFGGFSIFGYKPGWLMTYIVFSVALSILTRKLFKIY